MKFGSVDKGILKDYFNTRIKLISKICYEDKQKVFLTDDDGRRLVVMTLSDYENLTK